MSDMARKVVDILIDKNMHIAFAESCTGGLACGRLVDIPDASRVLDVSFVTYANEAKMEYLSVDESLIEEFGVVSKEVAEAMAAGVANKAGCEVGVGITGVAGPTGGTERKPVGMVCFGFSINGEVTTYEMQFGNIGRNVVREKSVEFVYKKLEELL